MKESATLIEIFRRNAEDMPDRILYRFLSRDDREEALSYCELDIAAKTIAANLQRTCSPGDRALLLLQPGLEYIKALFACFYAGVVAVPVYPPTNRRNSQRVELLAKDSGAGIALTGRAQEERMRSFLDMPEWLVTDSALPANADSYLDHHCTANSLALLQYTSGSTGDPKGVMLTHANLAHNAGMIVDAMDMDQSSVMLSWLPPYHDMGLIGAMLSPLPGAAEIVLMAPATFVQKPFRWLKAISDYRATISGGPNFAYDLCVDKITEEQRRDLDLSSWRVAFNGAEPVRSKTLEAFSSAFKQCGFSHDAFYPCYGLAEATLLVSGGEIAAPPVSRSLVAGAMEKNEAVAAGKEDARARDCVSVGWPRPGQVVRIVDPESQRCCPRGKIGEIWVSGPHIANGYWKRPEQTENTFYGCLRGDADPAETRRFLRTGDLGFMDGGELFVTGRLKDLMIINGRNLYPQDIEGCAQGSHPSLRPNASAAFSCDIDGAEQLVLVQELEFRKKPDPDEVFSAICGETGNHCQVVPYAIVLARPGSVPKTSSGKIRRRECKRRYLEGQLQPVAEWCRDRGVADDSRRDGSTSLVSEAEIRRWLAGHLAGKLGCAEAGIDANRSYLELGLSSIDAIQITAELETWLGTSISPMLVWDYPTIAETSTYLASTIAGCADASLPVPTVSAEREACLSHAQRRLWFACQYQKEYRSVYNIPAAVRLRGELDVDALKNALQAIVDRHESLRTGFSLRHDEPVQLVRERLRVTLAVIGVEESSIASVIAEHAQSPFDLSEVPLWKLDLLQLSPEDHLFLLNMHHTIADGWSLKLFMRELSDFYSAFLHGRTRELDPLPLQYADYTRWWQDRVSQDTLARQTEFWKKYLAEAPPLLELPGDRSRPPEQSFRGAVEYFSIRKTLAVELKSFAARSNVTLFMLLFAVFNLLLSRYGNQRDLVVGVPIAGRNRPELQNLIGFFVNVLPIRTRIDWNSAFPTLLKDVRENCIRAYRNQDLSFEALVEALRPERSSSYHPIYQVAFALQDTDASQLQLEGLTSEPVESVTYTAKQDLFMQCWEQGDTLRGSVEFSTDLFDADTVRDLIGHFKRLLQSAIATPEIAVGEIPLISRREYGKLYGDWHRTEAEYSRICVHRIFEARVEQNSGDLALVMGGESITYGELNRRCNQLAHCLIGKGVGPEVPVGVCLPRSVEMLVSLIAVLKAGGCYVPIDASYPAARIAYMVDDGGMDIVIGERELLEQALPASGNADIICPAGIARAAGKYPANNPETDVTPLNLAYIIYTSGSTGKPKGTLLTHKGAANLVAAQKTLFNIGPGNRVMQFASAGFDAATWEWLMALTQGATLCLATEDEIRPGPDLTSVLRRHRIDHITLPPSILATLEPGDLPDLQTLVVAGEACPPALARKWLERKIVNAYGPTESTVCATAMVCTQDRLPPCIGRPIGNMRAYVLDDGMNLLPPGIPGELYLAGDGLARGYHRRAGLTAERLLPDPFATGPGQRIYRTGDLALYSRDGNIEFLGRADHQVKLRGYRIELGEVEQALREQVEVRDSVAAVHRRANGEAAIAAYLVPEPHSSAEQGDLRGQVSMWRDLYEHDVYRDKSAGDPLLNFNGWVSSYSGERYPAEQMTAWAEQTAERIAALGSGSILEIGCGQGLFLFRLLSRCRSYTATDFSSNALDYISKKLSTSDRGDDVELLCRDASNFDGLPEGNYDTVVLNSVIQYFPGEQYLEGVLANSLRVVKDGGAVFIGDVRNFDLAYEFYTSVLLRKTHRDMSVGELRQGIYQQQLHENELLLSPDYFLRLPERHARISTVEILPKHDTSSLLEENELFKYRYDVILHLSEKADRSADADRLLWDRDDITLERLESYLSAQRPEVLFLEHIPDVRIRRDLKAAEVLRDASAATLAELEDRISGAPATVPTIDTIVERADNCGYSAIPSLVGCSPGHYTLVLSPASAGPTQRKLFFAEGEHSRAGGALANNPLQGQLAVRLIPKVRERLKEQLPDYMVPAFFVLLDKMPLTPSGKVDRRALPAPGAPSGALRAYTPPGNRTEADLTRLWAELLAVDGDSLGTGDNFFEVGGHSLLAAKLQKAVSDHFDTPISVADIFEQPTIGGLAGIIEVRASTGGENRREQIPRLPLSDQGYALSASQLRLWLTCHMDSTGSAHHNLEIMKLPRPWSCEGIESALGTLVERHESLRTVFRLQDGEPRQYIRPPFAIRLERHTGDGDTGMQSLLERYARTPFDLSEGPLLRLALLEDDSGERNLLWCMHEIVADGSSAVTLRDEFWRLMESSDRIPLPEPAVRYRDFAAWQNSLLSGERGESSRKYWHQQLAGDLPRADLPFDFPLAEDTPIAGASHMFAISPQTRQLMESVARQYRVTPFVILQTALSVFLYRLTGQRDIILAAPVSGRDHPDLEGVVGFFLNTLLLRHRLDDRDTFASLLDRVKQTTVQGLSHQHYPFEQLLDELKVRRLPNAFPVTPVVLNMLSFMRVETGDPLESQIHYNRERGKGEQHTYYDSKVELEIYAVEQDGELAFRVHYRRALFREATIGYLMQEFARILQQGLEAPDMSLADYRAFAEPRVLDGRNYPEALQSRWLAFLRPLQQRLEYTHVLEGVCRQVALRPEAPALQWRQRSVSYAQMWSLVEAQSGKLRAGGVCGGCVVGLMVEDPVQRIVGLLAVMHLGAIVTPFSHDEPLQRQRRMVAQVEPAAWLTDRRGAERLAELDIGEATQVQLMEGTAEPPVAFATPEWKAPEDDRGHYIFFTSGSTGDPKPILGRAESLAHYVQWQIGEYGLDAGSRVSQLAAPVFDASLRDIFVALCSGGTACIPPHKAAELAPDDLVAWLESARVTLVHSVPSMFRNLLGFLATENLPDLQYLMLAGEALLPGDLRQWRRLFGDRIQLINLYGATETTLVKCCHRTGEADAARDHISIGRPIPGCAAMVLNERGQVCSPGEAGELYLRTPYATCGYYRQEEKTAETFVANPFGNGGERIYRTGDLARWWSDGKLQLLGRKDQQIKIRGVRVEAGEIESRLLEQPGVALAVVVAVDLGGGDLQLQAHLEAQEGAELCIDAIREDLKTHLPAPFLPGRIEIHDALPRTATGKVDRQQLVIRAGNSAQSQPAPPGATTKTEEKLMDIWRDVLGDIDIDRNSDFFSLGGHSLKTLLLVSRVRKVFGTDLDLAVFFRKTRLRDLAQHIDAMRGREGTPALEPAEAAELYPLTSAQHRLWILHQLDEMNSAHHIPVVVQLRDDWSRGLLERALEALIRRHEPLRTRFVPRDDQVFQRISPPFALELAEYRAGSEGELSAMVAENTSEPFDLREGPLLRARVVIAPDGRRLLLLCLHEIVADGSSSTILQHEFLRLLESPEPGWEKILKPLPVQYKDFAVWQKRHLEKDTDQSRAYWHRQLQGYSHWLELPYDFPIDDRKERTAALYEVILPGALKQRLAELAQSRQVTLFMLMQAVLCTQLARLSGQRDMVLAVPASGREQPGLENMVGFFLNTILLRHHLDPDDSFGDFLNSVKKATMRGLAHQQYPFEMLLEELDLPRTPFRFPVTPVLLNLLNFRQLDGVNDMRRFRDSLEETSAEGLGAHRALDRQAKVELELYLVEHSDALRLRCQYRSDLFRPETIEKLISGFVSLTEQIVESPDNALYTYTLDGLPDGVAQMGEKETSAGEKPHPSEAPKGEIEKKLAGIWSEILSVEPVGRSDDFFTIGGHSLKALSMISRVRKTFEVRIHPRELFEAPTLAEFARRIAGAVRQGFEPIAVARSRPRYPVSAAQHSLWLQQELNPENIAYNIGSLLEIGPKWEFEAVSWVIGQLVARHEPLRTLFEYDGESLYQRVLPAFEVKPGYSEVANEAVLKALLSEHIRKPFDMERGPLFRAHLAVTADGHRFLLWCMHEIVADGSSAVILQRETELLLKSYGSGTAPGLAALPVQYKDFASWQAGRVESVESPARQYWLEEFNPVPHRLSLPFDVPPTAQTHRRGAVFECPVPVQIGEQLKALAKQHRATLFMVLQAALGTVLMRLTGLRDIVLAAPVSGRGHPDVENLVGFFLNTLLLRHRLSDEQSFSQLLRNTKEVTLKGLEHQYYPFERLVEELNLSYSPDRFPATPVMLNMLNFLDDRGAPGAQSLPGPVQESAAEPGRRHYEVDRDTKVELELYVTEHPDRIQLRFLYRRALFRPQTIEEFADGLLDVMQQATADPETKLSEYRLENDERWAAVQGGENIRSLPEAYEAPKGETERKLATLWAEILGVEPVGRNHDFFTLGGHSLKALSMISRARRLFGVRIDPASLFEAPVLADFAQRVERAGTQKFPSIEPAERRGRYRASPPQIRLWLQYELRPQTTAHNLASTVELGEGEDPELLQWVLNRLIERHEALRTVFERDGEDVYQRVLPPFEVELTEAEAGSEAELAQCVRDNTVKPFDLSRGPLFRACLVRRPDRKQLLLWCMHEIIADGSSSVILQKEISRLIEIHRRDDELPAVPKIQYKDFSEWQWRQATAEQNPARDYWHRHLRGPINWLDMPFDSPPGAQSHWESEAFETNLPVELKTGLEQLAQSCRATPFMVLQSALTTLLMRLTGQSDIVLSVPVSGREHPDIQATVGFFLNTILLRHRVDPQASFTQLLGRVRETTLEGLKWQQYPFEQLLEELDLPREPNRFPATPVMFNMLNFTDRKEDSAASSLTGNRRFRDAKTELELDAFDTGKELRLRAFYRSALFKRSTIEYLIGELVSLLEQVVDGPSRSLAQFDLFKQHQLGGESYPEALNSAYLDFVGEY